MYCPAIWEVVVDQLPLELPPLPEPQEEAVSKIRPLLSVWRHLVPDPAKLESVRVPEERAVEIRLPIFAVLE